MKPPILLKTILDILFILLIGGTVIFIILVALFMLNSEGTIPFRVNENMVQSFNAEGLTILGFILLSRIIFIYAVFRFKRLVRLFFKGEIFSVEQARATGIIGKLVVVVALLDTIPSFIYQAFFEESPREVKYGLASVDSFWFILVIGLFFIFLGKIFDNARILKEENDLTV